VTAIEQLRDEIANLHLLADRLASRSPSHDLVEAADAMRDQYVEQWQAMYENDDTPDTALAYDTARARHAEGAQPSGAPAPASAQGEVCECGHIAAIHDDPHGDGAHGGSCLEIIGKCSDGSDDFCCCSEFHHAQ